MKGRDPIVRLEGYTAIIHAEEVGRDLCKHADPTDPARCGIDPAEARDIAAFRSSLVYIDVHEWELSVATSRAAHGNR